MLFAIQPQCADALKQPLIEDIAANSAIQSISVKPPMIAEGRQRIAQLDYELGEKLMPINGALRFMLEKIFTLSFYAQDVNDGVAA